MSGMTLFRSRVVQALTVLAVLLTLVGVLRVYFLQDVLPPQLIIHFDAFRGADFFGDITDVWWISALAVGMMALNAALAVAFFHRERIISYLLVGTNTLLALLLFIALSTILSVN